MAIDILRRPNIWGESLAKGVDALAKGHMDYLTKKQREQALAAAGLPKEYAGFSDTILAAEINNRARAKIASDKLAYQKKNDDLFEQYQNQLNGGTGQEQDNTAQQRYVPQQTGLPKFNTPGQEFNDRATENQLGGLAGMPQTRGNQATVPSIGLGPEQQQNNGAFQQQPKRSIQSIAPANRPIPRGLKPADYLKFQNANTTAQAKVNSENAKANAELDKKSDTADATLKILDDVDRLLATGNVASGAEGRYKPWIALNKESRAFADLANQLAAQKVESLGGRSTEAQIKLAERLKIRLDQLPEEQKYIANFLRNEAEVPKRKAEIREQILNENNRHQIPNMTQEIARRYKEQYGSKPLGDLESGEVKQINKVLDSFQQAQDNNENWADWIVRNAVGIPKSVGAGAVGIPGDILSSALGLANKVTKKTDFDESQLAQAAHGQELSPEVKGSQDVFRNLHKGKQNLLSSLHVPETPTYEQLQDKTPVSFPTSTQAHEFIDKLTNGLTKPRDEFEQSIQNIATGFGSLIGGSAHNKVVGALSKFLSPVNASKAASLVLPFSGVPWKQALKASVASEAGGKGAEFFGAGPESQMLARLAAGAVALSHGTSGRIDEGITQAYEAAEQKGAKIHESVNPIKQDLRNYSKSIPRNAPHRDIATNLIDETISTLDQYAHGGTPAIPNQVSGKSAQISASDLVKTKQATNEHYKLSTEPKQPGYQHLPPAARKYPAEITRILNKHIEPLAVNNPEFGKPYAMAEDMMKAKGAAQKTRDFLEGFKLPKGNVFTDAGKLLLGGLGEFTLGNVGKLYQLMKHPVTRKYYLEGLQAAAQGNTAAFAKSLNSLNKIGKKEER
jgi:hypothetical protein